MNVVDQIIVQAYRSNPIFGALLSVLADGGRIVAFGEKSEALLNLIPGVLFFERRFENEMGSLSDYCERDLILVEDKSVDRLLELNQVTGAQIALMTEGVFDLTLVDLTFKESDLRSALLELAKPAEQLKQLKKERREYHLQGSHLNKALFLDRDGVLIENVPYANDPQKVVLREGVIEGLKKARELGYFLIVVSNQSGIGRGLVSWAQYEKVSHRMQELLAPSGIFFDRVLRAPFFDGSQYASGLIRRSLRKPRAGMLHQPTNEFRLDLSQSIMIGDSAADLMAGCLAGLQEVFLMDSGKASDELQQWNSWPLRGRGVTKFSGKAISKIEKALPV
ncbi:MAG: D-glycero-alpha-D-manno-heptose-1,7-bisphosphate 7-phosphatase [Pseudobdellovibrionaceae bacterium]